MLARADTCFEFGPLRLVPSRRALYADGRPVAIHGRALDLLAVLVEHRDRVVGRDELLARVWAGSTVSDNNIAVQIASLRRVLSAHGIDPQSIVNVSGRGYQFVGPTSVHDDVSIARLVDEAKHDAPECPVPAPRPARRASSRRMLVYLGALTSVLVGLASVAVWGVGAGDRSREDLRLTIGLRPLRTIGGGLATALAPAYTDALLTHTRWYGDFRVFDLARAERAHPTRYVLSGSLQVLGTTALLSYTLASSDGELIHGSTDVVSIAPRREDLLEEATAVYQGIAPDLFRAERSRRHGPARDALDYVVEAQVATAENDALERYDRAVALAEQAVVLDRSSLPARLLLACLLVNRLSMRPAQDGDQDGRRALSIVHSVLIDHPGNAVALQVEAVGLLELGDPRQAEIIARRALALDPASPSITTTLLDALEQDGRFQDADSVVASGQVPEESAEIGQLAFARGDYTSALNSLDRYLVSEPVDLEARLMTLLKAASLVRLTRLPEATALVSTTLINLPVEFRSLRGLRRTFYGLPPPAWAVLRSALGKAGMAS